MKTNVMYNNWSKCVNAGEDKPVEGERRLGQKGG